VGGRGGRAGDYLWGRGWETTSGRWREEVGGVFAIGPVQVSI
jgi:hypothetical protein